MGPKGWEGYTEQKFIQLRPNCLNKLWIHTNSYSDYALQCPHNKVTVLHIAYRHLHLHLVEVLMVRIKFKSSCCFQEIEGRIIYLLNLNVVILVRAFDFNDT